MNFQVYCESNEGRKRYKTTLHVGTLNNEKISSWTSLVTVSELLIRALVFFLRRVTTVWKSFNRRARLRHGATRYYFCIYYTYSIINVTFSFESLQFWCTSLSTCYKDTFMTFNVRSNQTSSIPVNKWIWSYLNSSAATGRWGWNCGKHEELL